MDPIRESGIVLILVSLISFYFFSWPILATIMLIGGILAVAASFLRRKPVAPRQP